MKHFLLPALAAIMGINTAPAYAQTSFGGDEPIDVIADRAAYKGAKTTLTGKVRVTQGTSKIFSDTMDLIRAELRNSDGEKTAYGKVNRIVASGNFRYETPKTSVIGNKGVYERDKNIITVTGNVTYAQKNGNKASGEILVYDLTKDQARFGGNCAGEDCEQTDRVTITYTPNKD